MKFIITVLMLFPIGLLAQNVGIGTEVPAEQLEVNGIIFTSHGGVRFPDGTLQTTAYVPSVAMMDMDLSAIVIEFASSSLVIGPAFGDGINSGINVSSVSDGMSAAVSIVPGSITPGDPSLGHVGFTRDSDVNSAQLRSLMISKTPIPYIELFNLVMGPNNYLIQHITRYENCYISSVSMSASASTVFESVTFAFAKACYRSYERDGSGISIREVNTCIDLTNLNGPCSCGTF